MASRHDVLGTDLFTAHGRTFRWRDVVEAARIRGDWGEIEDDARRSRALLREPQVPADEVEEAQIEFRYAHDLLAAEDLEEWLARWGISLAGWADQVAGAVERERRPDAARAAMPAADEEATWAEAVCSGRLERLAQELAERAALAGPDLPELTPEGLERMEAAAERFRAAAADEAALERRLGEERVEWTRVEGRYLAHHDEDVVREAALCVREEGRDLEELARLAGARWEPSARFYLSDLDADLKARLLAANPGEVCGPLPVAGERWLLELDALVAPSLADPELRERAVSAVVGRAVTQEVLRHVRWYEP